MLNAGKVILGANAATWAPVDVQYEQRYHLGVVDVEQFVAGVINGLIQKDDLPEIQKCLANTETVTAEVNKIVNEMSVGSLTAIIQGIKDAAALIQELPTDLKDCENIQDDVTKITNWGSQVISPTGLAKIFENVMANWANIQSDIGNINSDLQNSQYEQAGEATADVVILAMGKIQYAELNAQVNEAIQMSHDMYLY